MDQGAGTPGRLARVRPRRTEVDNPRAVAVEHVRADRPRLLQRLVNRELVLEHLFDRCREWKRSPFAVFRRAGVQAHRARLPIDVPPFERQDFARRAPSGGEGEPHHVRQLARRLASVVGRFRRLESHADPIDLVLFEEPRAGVAFFQHREVRLRQ